MTAQNTLCIDIGTVTGWAHIIDGKIVASGSQSFKHKRKENPDVRFYKFKAWLDDYVQQHDVSVIAYEDVCRHLGTNAAHVFGGFKAAIFICCAENFLDHFSINVGTIKKHITGRGGANKLDIINAVEKLGHSPADDNEADAIALAYTVIAERN